MSKLHAIPSHYTPLQAQQYLLLPLLVQKKENQPCEIKGWQAAALAVMGHRHSVTEQPCQDAASAQTRLRPIVVNCDGAGSAKLSHFGSNALSQQLQRLFMTLEPLLAEWLDTKDIDTEQVSERLASIIARHSKGIIKDIALKWQQPETVFRSTLLIAIMGKYHHFWLQIGDGYLLRRCEHDETHGWQVIVMPEKGEFANHTCFVDPTLTMEHVQYGMASAEGISGLVAMSDGAAERLMNLQHHTCGPLVERFASSLSEQSLQRILFEFLSDPLVWGKTSGDDKSISMVVAAKTAVTEQ